MTPPKGIPEDAVLVFRGTLYDVWQWMQIMYDGSTRPFQRLVAKESVDVFAMVGDKFIVQEQEQPHRSMFYSLPGGRCDTGETLLETAARELLEETGYQAEQLQFWQTMGSGYSSIIKNTHYVIARNCTQIQDVQLDNGERIQNRLVDFEGLCAFILDEKFRDKRLKLYLLEQFQHPQKKEAFKTLLFSGIQQ